jgi:hypothetical protein
MNAKPMPELIELYRIEPATLNLLEFGFVDRKSIRSLPPVLWWDGVHRANAPETTRSSTWRLTGSAR